MRFLAPLAAFCALAAAQPLRPPAVPLVAHDPYFSIWSTSDQLTGENTRHWTGKPHSLAALVRVDGTQYRVIGKDPAAMPALGQTRVEVLPTRTIYGFEGAGIRLTLTFLTPALVNDLDMLSRPLTYVVWDVQSADGGPHEVKLYFEAAADLAVNTSDQPVVWSRLNLDGRPVLRVGSREQPVLQKSGDDLRIDWGYLYLMADRVNGVSEAAVDRRLARAAFEKNGGLPQSDDFSEASGRRARPVLAMTVDFGKLPATRYLALAYDDLFSIEYFHRKLRPWWRRNGAEMPDLLRAAVADYPQLVTRTRQFDEELMADLRRTGGDHYAQVAALAYRQALAAHKLVADIDGTPLYFSKENYSNGCIDTVDVFYPSAPLFLLMNPTLLRAQMQPILDYASMERWRFPFAPHDLGTYPLANGQVYGGGERTEENQMPVEESGNMLILAAALAHVEGGPEFSVRYWPVLSKWAAYLKEKGLDPENQLSTDDFAGHLAHNSNLSIKAIVALASYARLAEMAGKRDVAAEYRATAEQFTKRWVELAKDGDHYKLAFDKPGTWSQKYNLVWDKLLGFKLFPPEIAKTELAFYKTKQLKYGLPLDNRKEYTKLDWIVWTATLADTQADFAAFITPVHRFLNESPSRVPMTDWYWTHDGKQAGFQARSVVGGVFIKPLADGAMWKKWAAKAQPVGKR
ncbi:MAG TPA: DUF4965 domain-containing protein [Bryobacteraceae bacterium]|nr:DUF4965 domain-containing protein [Bryobacteraceae bacterium]